MVPSEYLAGQHREKEPHIKVELINPATQKNRRRRGLSLCPPLGLAMVAALTPEGVEVSLTDENVTDIDFQREADLVGITTLTITAERAYEIADTFRARGVKVVLGGVHPSFLPEEASRHADAVVIGEAEGIWPNLIEDFKADKLQRFYRQCERPNLLNLPLPRRDLFSEGAYLVKHTVSTTRGCPYSCSFCSATAFFGHTYRCRPVGEVLKEIETLKDRKFIAFVDDNIVGNPKHAKELFRALIPYKIKWFGQASVKIASDDQLLKLAADSGCSGLLIGFESISTANLEMIGKWINSVNQYENVIRKIHSHGISIHGCFIFGFDGDNEGMFKHTVWFAQKMRLESANFGVLTPYPGTVLFESMDKAGRIVTKDWIQYEYGIVYEPRSMSGEILQKWHGWACRKFFSIPSIWRRVGMMRRNLFILWALNLYYRAYFRGKPYALRHSSKFK